jgi:hypothetical protein
MRCLVRAIAQLRRWLEMGMSNVGMMISRQKPNKLREKSVPQTEFTQQYRRTWKGQ